MRGTLPDAALGLLRVARFSLCFVLVATVGDGGGLFVSLTVDAMDPEVRVPVYVSITNSLFAANSAVFSGGGVRVDVEAGAFSDVAITIDGTRFVANAACEW